MKDGHVALFPGATCNNQMTGKNTIRLSVSADTLTLPQAQAALAQAAEVLRAGGTVAFPTETVYGLGANALDPIAVEGIFLAKQRPAWDPMIVHVADRAMLEQVAVRVPRRIESGAGRVRADQLVGKLISKFWPGPLTLLLPRQPTIPPIVTAGRALVGVRMPAHPVALALIAAARVPIAAPSANRFGHTSPTTAEHVLEDLDGRIDMVLDAGPAWCGVESTVLEVGEQGIILYRPGAISVEEIEAVAGPVALYQPPSTSVTTPPESLPSPGVDMRHYAPKARVFPVELAADTEAKLHTQWLQTVVEKSQPWVTVGIMLPTDWPLPAEFSGVCYDWGSWGNDRQLAQRLFAGLRSLDAMGADVIVCPLPPVSGMGTAIRDRLLKAARTD